MKRALAIVFAAILIALLVIPAGTTLADQNFHTIKVPIYLTAEGEAAGHTLQNGWYKRTNTEGPINYFIESYKLTGAKPNTRYELCAEMEAYPGLIFCWEDYYIQTNNSGNAHVQWKFTPEQVWDMVEGEESLSWNFVFIEGGTPVEIIPGTWIMVGGTRAFETDVFEVCYDWD
jgi:hypothetical protein